MENAHTKQYLQSEVMKAISLDDEFGWLERKCYVCFKNFDEELVDSVLDSYNYMRKERQDKFTSKYVALYEAGWNIIFGEPGKSVTTHK